MSTATWVLTLVTLIASAGAGIAPDPLSAKMEYQFRSGDQAQTAWTPVSGVSPAGQATFKVNNTGTLWVRVQASDMAKNLSHWEEGQVSSIAVASATGTSPGGLPA